MSVTAEQRFSPSHPCPICGGHAAAPSGRGERCYGFLSSDGGWAHCTREEHAGGLERKEGSGTYPHRLEGECACGVSHGALPTVLNVRSNGHRRRRSWEVRKAGGELAGVHHRRDDEVGKRMWWTHPDGSKGLGGMGTAELPLYRSEHIKDWPEDVPVILVEGEKAADEARTLPTTGRDSSVCPRGHSPRTGGIPRSHRYVHSSRCGILDSPHSAQEAIGSRRGSGVAYTWLRAHSPGSGGVGCSEEDKGDKMTEERIPTIVPGDKVDYVVVLTYPANIRTVTAAFRNEETGEEILLWGRAHLSARARILGTRTHEARLHYHGEGTPSLGTYRLARLVAETYSGKPLDFDNPPEDAFRFEDEPDESVLPRIARGPGALPRATWFELPEGHPTRPPGE